MAGPATVDEYLATLTQPQRAGIEAMRATITAAAPGATETIAYAMPALRSHGGRFLVSYQAFTRHFSLFPASDRVVHELSPAIEPYLSGKGTIRFPADQPLPLDLIDRIVRIRWAENEAAGPRR